MSCLRSSFKDAICFEKYRAGKEVEEDEDSGEVEDGVREVEEERKVEVKTEAE